VTLSNGNCQKPDADGLPVQCVGRWSDDKHFFLRKYIEATRAVRAKYLPPKGDGGAAFIDLFAGPGRKRLRETGEVVDGSPLIAANASEAPFSRIIACDLDDDNVHALRKRLAPIGERAVVLEGDCNERIADVLHHAPEVGLNLAFIDPFGLNGLKFETLRRIAALPRTDLLLHFPRVDIKRNIVQGKRTEDMLDEALGTRDWRKRQQRRTDVASLVEVFIEQLRKLGYSGEAVRVQPIKNRRDAVLYWLICVSKHPLGEKIWASVLKRQPTGQGLLDLR
jgi:three-Cys-motif partner protein